MILKTIMKLNHNDIHRKNNNILLSSYDYSRWPGFIVCLIQKRNVRFFPYLLFICIPLLSFLQITKDGKHIQPTFLLFSPQEHPYEVSWAVKFYSVWQACLKNYLLSLPLQSEALEVSSVRGRLRRIIWVVYALESFAMYCIWILWHICLEFK